MIDNLDAIGGHTLEVLGAPRIIDGTGPGAVEFDGVGDGLIVDTHPLCGVATFTAEVIFRPDPDGPPEQRFVHLQEDGSKDRILFETRLVGTDRWFLDTYIKSAGEGYTLFARKFRHPLGPWYHAALVVDGDEMRHYVNGKLEMARPIVFSAQREGRTSIGVRMNRVSWFKGAVREVRFTPTVLPPEDFLTAD